MSISNILGTRVDAQRFDEAVAKLLTWAGQPDRRYVCTCTVYTLMMSERDSHVQAALEEADMVTADGMPLVWLQRRLGNRAAERVYGPDIVVELCRQTSARGDRHFFYGGLPGIAEQMSAALRSRFPDLTVAGAYSPADDALANLPDPATITRINDARPDIVWIGLGSPRQDLWMHGYRPHLNAPLLIGVGAAFDFLAGAKPQAPVWMRRHGLEWLFRLASEPQRLWRRYLVYNARFVVRVLWTYGVRGEHRSHS